MKKPSTWDGFWELCACGAYRGAHDHPANNERVHGGWVKWTKPCEKFYKIKPTKVSIAKARIPREPKKKKRKKPDPFIAALKERSRIDRLSNNVRVMR